MIKPTSDRNRRQERTCDYTRRSACADNGSCNRSVGTRRQSCECSFNSCNSKGDTGERLLILLRRLDFALVETNLYLDTHPNNRTALSYFNRLLRERQELAEKYEQNYAPLTAAGNGSRNEFLWSTGAWPWQQCENMR